MTGISRKKRNMLIVMVVLLTILLIWLVIAVYESKINRMGKKIKSQPVSQNIKSDNQNLNNETVITQNFGKAF